MAESMVFGGGGGVKISIEIREQKQEVKAVGIH